MSDQLWNAAQLTALRTYCNGEFKYMRSMGDVRVCGDGLLAFLLVELSEEEACTSTDEAFSRVAAAIEQLREVLAALDSITEEDLT